ncbi:hypothetical protein [Zoogloea sp.]|uniref:hypothetical protein n=1 Tax=Zoogloea sp. TaxID=49181 RepID=UPI002606F8F8|nr:hypothetical protein [Zoogloea sp.]
MKTIYLIDDDAGRHLQLAALIDSLNASLPDLPEYQADNCPNDRNAAVAVADNSVNCINVWTAITAAPPDSIFLVDLHLGDVSEVTSRRELSCYINNSTEPWGETARSLLNEATDIHNQLLTEYSTAVLACAVLKAREIPVILISTAAGSRAFRPWCDSWRIPYAPDRYDYQWKSWKEEIIKLHRHPDSITRQILELYAQPITSDSNAWLHDWCEENVELGQNIWNCSFGDDMNTADCQNKAIHIRQKAWGLSDSPSRPMNKSVVLDAVKKLNFDFSVECICDNFVFPREPGIVFLLSLRELIVALGKNNPKPEAVRFGNEKNRYFVSVELQAANQSEMIDRLLRKDWIAHKTFTGQDPICEQIPSGGFSEAIFHFCHSRLAGISGDEDWVKLFRNGSRKWVAWPCLTNKGITFYW